MGGTDMGGRGQSEFRGPHMSVIFKQTSLGLLNSSLMLSEVCISRVFLATSTGPWLLTSLKTKIDLPQNSQVHDIVHIHFITSPYIFSSHTYPGRRAYLMIDEAALYPRRINQQSAIIMESESESLHNSRSPSSYQQSLPFLHRIPKIESYLIISFFAV